MTRFGLDSTEQVPTWAHHAVGSTVALRYLSRSTWKVVTRAEHDEYRRSGIDLCLVFEDDGRPDLHGYAGGKADAEFALNQSLAILGKSAMPPCITFAADYDPAGNAQATDAYYDGVASVIGRERTGPYGGFEIVKRQWARGFRYLWQTYAWSGGQFWSKAQLYQYSNDHTVGGAGTDYDHIYGEDFGQFDRKPPKPVDPYHYARFPEGPFAWKGRLLRERDAVKEYDVRRRHPLLSRRRLDILRVELKDLADRVYFEAHRDVETPAHGITTPPSWNAFYRGWRYQGLIRRAHGERLAG